MELKPSTGMQLQLTLHRDDFSLAVDTHLPATGVSVIFGHSGSGKTTLLRCIAGLERASGDVLFNGDVWQRDKQFIPTHRRPLAYVFQEASLFNHLTAAGNLQFAEKRAVKNTDSAISQAEQTAIIDMLGIGHTLKRYPEQLSGGERQRVAIARALLRNPRLLLMDEPLAALDEARKQDILPYLETLRRELSLPIIYVTHSIVEVARLADYLVAMRDGRIVAQGSLEETLADVNFPLQLGEEAGVVIDSQVRSVDQEWQLAEFALGQAQSIWLRNSDHKTSDKARLRILARDVSLASSPQHDSSIQNVLPCTVEAITADRHEALALVKVRVDGAPVLSRMTRRSVDKLQLVPGKTMWAQVKSAALV
tara:strand:+ start:40813 stop:41910 length:1098 start_codon:yes stop_codon:yes gene_type:complete